MMNNRHNFTMKTTRKALTDLVGRINALLEPRDLPDRVTYVVNLVLEEILTNIVKYGFDDDHVHDVEVTLILDPDEISIEFEDRGKQFDPLSVSPPPLDESLMDMEPGGRGIHLVRTMANSMTYRRDRDKNILTVSVRHREQ
ncbi:MAG: ATP-binding protein [Desulfomonilaceae bacterium]|nr:ATP-binding protein [Desulfomonilaceae bacterium]